MVLNTLKISLIMTLFLWAIFVLDGLFPWDLKATFGLKPRSLRGLLLGVPFAPFLHGNWSHLLSNSLPFLVLSFALLSAYKTLFWRILPLLILLTNLLVWLLARPALHIGMSGVIYGLIVFLAISGWFHKQFHKIALSLLIIVFYGGVLVGVLPRQPNISWESHLFGAIAGLFVAYLFRKRGNQNS